MMGDIADFGMPELTAVPLLLELSELRNGGDFL